MAYPKHYLLSFGGRLGLNETWSCGIRMWDEDLEGLSGSALQEQALEHVGELDVKVRNYLISISGRLHGHAEHGWTKFNAIGPEGKYLGSTTGEVIHKTPWEVPHGSTGPFQISTVVSFGTGVNRGLAVVGRIFLPTWPFPTDPTGSVVNAAVEELGEGTATFIRNLNNWDGIDTPIAPDCCVVSQGRKLPNGTYTEGLARRFDRIAVGRIQDTQRRRRAQLEENYHPVTL